MKNTASFFKGLGALGLLGLMLGATGCQTTGPRTFAQRWGDSQVAHEVRHELNRDRDYKYPNVHPMVYEGTVQLSGFVDTPEQRQSAAQLAARARGVRQVVNCIGLNPSPPIRERFPTNAPAAAAAGGGTAIAPVAAGPEAGAAAPAAATVVVVQTPPPAVAETPVPGPAPQKPTPVRVRIYRAPTQGAGAADLLRR